jgi:hypothetical protein
VELVENPYVSEFTKKTLGQFGWEEGDPIPVELGAYLIKIKETLPASARTDVLVDAALTTEEQRSEVQKLLAAAKVLKAQVDKKQEREKSLKDLNPNIRDAVANILSVVDDRAEAAPAEPAAASAEPPPAPEPAAPETAPQPAPAAEPLLVLPFCPRCGWDMRQKFEVKITDRDKEDFVAVLLGNTRFKKKYELLGGRLIVTLRGLLAEETKMIYKQLVVDQQEKRVNTEGEWYTQLLEYRLACSVEQVTDKHGKPLHIVPELKDIPFQPDAAHPNDTPLVAMSDYVNTTVLAQEVTKRLVGTHLRQFQRLVEALEAMALEPSFWDGIE